jgi:hypothetical protein
VAIESPPVSLSLFLVNSDSEPTDRAFVLSGKLLWYHFRE